MGDHTNLLETSLARDVNALLSSILMGHPFKNAQALLWIHNSHAFFSVILNERSQRVFMNKEHPFDAQRFHEILGDCHLIHVQFLMKRQEVEKQPTVERRSSTKNTECRNLAEMKRKAVQKDTPISPLNLVSVFLVGHRLRLSLRSTFRFISVGLLRSVFLVGLLRFVFLFGLLRSTVQSKESVGMLHYLSGGTWDPHDSNAIATTSESSVQFWDLRTMKKTDSIACSAYIRNVDYNPKRKHLLDETGISLWDLRKPKVPIQQLPGHTHWTCAVRCNPEYDGLILVFGFSLMSFPITRLLGKGFHTLINNVSFSSPTNVGYHNPPLFRAQRPRWLLFLSPIDVRPPPNPPPSESNILTGTPSCVYPLRGIVSSLAHCPMSISDTICDGPNPPLADIVLFGLSLSELPLKSAGTDSAVNLWLPSVSNGELKSESRLIHHHSKVIHYYILTVTTKTAFMALLGAVVSLGSLHHCPMMGGSL
ncbi:WD repeat-containing protein DWA2, partial [Cucurbita argyrosperma subsp. argyrosperma]